MIDNQNGPPKEVEGRAPHHRDRPSTRRFSSHHATYTQQQQDTANSGQTRDNALVWLPCTWDHPQDLASQLNRRRGQAARSVQLDCGCRDPWICRCTEPPLSSRVVDAWRDAAKHVLADGHLPLLPIDVRRALWRRDGADRALAELLHQACGGEIS